MAKEMEQFQNDLLESVRQMKDGKAADIKQAKKLRDDYEARKAMLKKGQKG